jgi:hypothetical protein
MFLGCLVVLASACASNPSPAPSGGAPAQSTTRSRDLIVEEELATPVIAASSVLDAIKALRPQFLTVHSVNSTYVPGTGDDETGKVHTSLDGKTIVPLNELTTFRASTVKEIRYLTAAQAQEKFGQASRQGPVIVITKK